METERKVGERVMERVHKSKRERERGMQAKGVRSTNKSRRLEQHTHRGEREILFDNINHLHAYMYTRISTSNFPYHLSNLASARLRCL